MAPFCSCPASLVSRKFFAVGPGCAKCFSFFALRWAPRPFGGARAKKKNTTQGVFFCSGPGERQGKEKPRWKPARGQSKKKTPPRVFFFAPAPGKGKGRRSPVGSRHGSFFFLLWPRAGFQRGFSFPCLSPGPQQKKTPWVVFFSLLWPRAGFQRGFSFPCLSPGPEQNKKHPGWCFFFCCGPARTLTHSLRAWVAMPPPRRGGVLFFAAAPPGPGWCFFFFAVAPPGRSLTHGGLGRFRQGPGGVFFLLRPRRVFETIAKNVWGTTSGLKRPGGATAKKKTPLP